MKITGQRKSPRKKSGGKFICHRKTKNEENQQKIFCQWDDIALHEMKSEFSETLHEKKSELPAEARFISARSQVGNQEMSARKQVGICPARDNFLISGLSGGWESAGTWNLKIKKPG